MEKTKGLGNYPALKSLLKKFSSEFGDRVVNSVKRSIGKFADEAARATMAPATIDYGINVVKVMVNKAFSEGTLGGDTLRVFKGIKSMAKKNANARSRILSPREFELILEKMPHHRKGSAFLWLLGQECGKEKFWIPLMVENRY